MRKMRVKLVPFGMCMLRMAIRKVTRLEVSSNEDKHGESVHVKEDGIAIFVNENCISNDFILIAFVLDVKEVEDGEEEVVLWERSLRRVRYGTKVAVILASTFEEYRDLHLLHHKCRILRNRK